jgi:hypothetical protein
MVIAFIKDILELLLRHTRIIMAGKKFIVNETLESIKKDGLFVVPSFLTEGQCKKYISIIDECIEDQSTNVWMDDEEADHRIYFINDINDDMNAFYKNEFIRDALTLYTGIVNPAGMLLAARIEYKKDNKGSGGGWHRDSPFNHQFKGICYLNDVHEDNGPFQYIKRSHQKLNVLSSYLRGLFSPGQSRFTTDEVNAYCQSARLKVSNIHGSSGTLILADTKGIHRGKPLDNGVRYVLFCYFWDWKIPGHFMKHRQGLN